MARIYISIGSNIDRERNIRAGVAELREAFANLQLSTVYESASVGFDGDAFYNLVAGADTDMSIEGVVDTLHGIEDRHGRTRSGPRFSSRTLDMDLLFYDDVIQNGDGYRLPREEILHNAFVLGPLAEIAPEQVHPETGRTCAAMWEAFDRGRQPLTAVRMDLG